MKKILPNIYEIIYEGNPTNYLWIYLWRKPYQLSMNLSIKETLPTIYEIIYEGNSTNYLWNYLWGKPYQIYMKLSMKETLPNIYEGIPTNICEFIYERNPTNYLLFKEVYWARKFGFRGIHKSDKLEIPPPSLSPSSLPSRAVDPDTVSSGPWIRIINLNLRAFINLIN